MISSVPQIGRFDELVDDRDAAYAHLLVDEVAAEQGLPASDLLRQADREYRLRQLPLDE